MDKEVLQIIINEINKYENLSVDDLIKIVQDERIQNYLKEEFKEDKINRSNLDKYKFNDNVISLFETYCDQNDIVIVEDIDMDNSDPKLESIRQYLNEIGKHPILTPNQEEELFIKYEEEFQ